MIYPRPSDILKTIDATIEAKVDPSLKDLTGRSAMATIRHLLRLVKVQIELEGQILTDDIAALRALLPRVRDYLASLEGGSGSEPEKIDNALTPAASDPTRYRTPDSLAEETAVLRECLYHTLRYLQGLRDARGEDEDYKAIRAAIRDYMVWQIAEEDKLIAPAFYGQGPRR